MQGTVLKTLVVKEGRNSFMVEIMLEAQDGNSSGDVACAKKNSRERDEKGTLTRGFIIPPPLRSMM